MKRIIFIVVLFCSISSVSIVAQDIVDKGFQSSLIAPLKVIKVGEGHYFIDFGKAAFGTLVLNFKTPQKENMIVHLGEKLIAPTAIDKQIVGSIRYSKLTLPAIPANTNYTLKLPADKRNTSGEAILLPDSFGVITPFRYCEIENLNVPITDVEIRQKTFNYAFNDNASSFTSSDSVLNKVWEMCKYTIKATSFAGLYIDGDRERIPYEADAYINQLSHYCVDNDYYMARKTNEYFLDHPTWPTEWILHTVLLFYYDYLYTGNTESIARNYIRLKNKMLMDLENDDHLLCTKPENMTNELMRKVGFSNPKQRLRDIVDWPIKERDGYEMTAINTVVNSFYYMNLKLMSEMAAAIGKKKDAATFNKKSLQVKHAINTLLMDKEKGIYVDGQSSKHASLHANMFPLAFGIVSVENTETVVAYVKSKGMACSVYGAQYLLEALYKQGEANYALDLMTSKSDRSWWNMINIGSTMALEAWDMKYKPNADWNHAWGAAPANIVTRNMWGITPSKPGFTVAKIQPQLGRLTSSAIKVPTIRGEILAEYTLVDSKKTYSITLPKGMTGEFIVSKKQETELRINNKKMKPKNGFVKIKEGVTVIEEIVKII